MITNKALLIFAIMWNENKVKNLYNTIQILESEFGKIIKKSEDFQLSYSKYYEKEMGESLKKSFFITNCLIDKEDSIKLKHYSMILENKFRENGNRTVNIDPVYLDEYQVVALSHKNKGSRIYIGNGIYAEMELLYHHGSFQPLLWTYLDYKDNVNFFNEARKYFLKRIENA